ncbi:uncharacterized protein LOC100571576 [Acyrthosiphon pisum]|uniref:Uncharacterized protein n=1 Tax=Acyrthosiphon pisum TaxID=7029 RepID=A0A8R1W4T9_ACYPI|nr:uncharacterized protein LOC100571576 [Acyrthosiphon pisum]|eukprot:XP_003243311.3 PREDICTED: uncharacterized protein LOC100571576 [Acyrthosiphon pisum]
MSYNYNVMTSITKILILIAAISAISGKTIDFNIDTDQPSAQVSYRDELLDTLSRLKLIAPEDDEPPSSKADTTNTKSIVSQNGNQWERRQARCADNGSHSPMSFTSFRHLSNVPRFPNGDVVDYNKISMDVLNWIRQQLIVKMMNQVQKSAAKNQN